MILVILSALLLTASISASAGQELFGDKLHAKFHHERCLQCHQFNSHRSQGRAWNSHKNRYLCDQCHKTRLTNLQPGEWMAPVNEKMNYTGFSARDTCLMIKRNSGGGPDKKRMLADHLLQDKRIFWALENGVTPAGKRSTVPGGYSEWKRDVDNWIASGMPCD